MGLGDSLWVQNWHSSTEFSCLNFENCLVFERRDNYDADNKMRNPKCVIKHTPPVAHVHFLDDPPLGLLLKAPFKTKRHACWLLCM